ncbi:MAG: ABC transporter permease [Lachnospira eligens]
MNVLKITFKSIRRRFSQIWKAALTTLVAVFFVTVVLIFQENMYQWQMSSNKSRFGDWFICERSKKEANEILSTHNYLCEPVSAKSSVELYDSEWNETKLHIGSMTDDFIKQGRLKLDEGRMPQNNDEIAMDWNTLLKLGYAGELGQKITIYYYRADNINYESDQRIETYTLVGIFQNYTNIWQNGKMIPGALVTDEKLNDFDYKIDNLYLYGFKDSIRTSEYANVYKKIKEDIRCETVYNAAVYDYSPWKSATVYMYMYVVVMVIGILALSYQLIEYRNTRRKSYNMFSQMGMTKAGIRKMYITENAFILIPAGIIGILLALAVGHFTGQALEAKSGYEFYRVNMEVIIKSASSVVIAVIVEELSGIISNIHFYRKKAVSKKWVSRPVHMRYKKSRMNRHNLVRSVSSRFIRKDGALMAVGIRLFALCICGVIIFSALKIQNAFKEYKSNDSVPDIYGYIDVNQDKTALFMNYWYYLKDYNNLPLKSMNYTGEITSRNDMSEYVSKQRIRYNIHFDKIKELVEAGNMWDWNDAIKVNDSDSIGRSLGFINMGQSKYLKDPNNNILEGFSKEFIDELMEINGINSVSYSTFESERSWFWDAQDYEKMQTFTFHRENGSYNNEHLPDYGDRYLFSTEYAQPTKELYNKLEKYIDKEYVDYEAFEEGKQVVLFLRNLPDGGYDDTIHAGDTLYYNYYQVSTDTYEKFSNKSYYYYFPYEEAFAKAKAGNKKDDDELIEMEINYDACVAPQVAAVVKVTDEVIEDFKGIIPAFGYYTSIASINMAQQAVDRQKDVMERYLGQELSSDMDFELSYNQISINYDLASTFSATNNKIGVYFNNNDISYDSNVDVKNTYRTQLINSILQYGITIIAMIIVQLLIMAIIVRNRMDRRYDKIKLLHGLGMRRGKIVRICMAEALRESLWCVITMPLILLMELLMYAEFVRKL